MPHLTSVKHLRVQELQATRQQLTKSSLKLEEILEIPKHLNSSLNTAIESLKLHWNFGYVISLAKAVNITAEGKWNTIQKHFHKQVICESVRTPLRTSRLLYNVSLRLCASGRKRKCLKLVIFTAKGTKQNNDSIIMLEIGCRTH